MMMITVVMKYSHAETGLRIWSGEQWQMYAFHITITNGDFYSALFLAKARVQCAYIKMQNVYTYTQQIKNKIKKTEGPL